MSQIDAVIGLGLLTVADFLIWLWHLYPRKRSVFS